MQGAQDFSREAGDLMDRNHYNTKDIQSRSQMSRRTLVCNVFSSEGEFVTFLYC